MVIDFPVEHESAAPAPGFHRLMTRRREIDNRQPRMAERNPVSSGIHRQDAGAVRPAVAQQIQHVMIERLIYGSQNSAHIESGGSPNVRSRTSARACYAQ